MAQGWLKIGKKRHYVGTDGRSLCGQCGQIGKDDLLERDSIYDWARNDNCVICRVLLAEKKAEQKLKRGQRERKAQE